MNGSDLRESVWIPTWQCHKQVRADKIVEITGLIKTKNVGMSAVADYSDIGLRLDCGAVITPVVGFFNRGMPKVGDFFVQYKDGYESWSPSAAFLEGYSEVH